jgi:glycosyltransferase involved in cell wall biosynthesis
VNPFVTIVIPTHDNLDMIRQVTAGIVAHTREPFEMIIVDNASSKPEVLGFLGEVSGYPCARVLHLPVNRFYWPAINAGIGLASPASEYVLALNDDIVIEGPSWLERLLDTFDGRSEVGYVGDFQPASFFPPLGGVTDGYCTLFRRRLFDEVGLFDEKRPFYWGFVDFQLRAHRRGFTTRDIKKAGDTTDHISEVVTHLRGRTLEAIRNDLSPNQKSVLFGSGWTPVELLMANGYYVEAAALAMVLSTRNLRGALARALPNVSRSIARIFRGNSDVW